MLLFDKIIIKNFQSYGNNFTELNLNTNCKTLLVGVNGQGKSSWIQALSYVLFNKSFSGGSLTNPRLINSINKKDMYVKLSFFCDDTHYEVERGQKPNIFNIYMDGILLPKPSNSDEYQVKLEKEILKFNFDAFRQVVILGKDSYVPFMKLSTPKRREVVESLLDLQIFGKMNNVLKLKISENDRLIKENQKDKEAENSKRDLVNSHIKNLDEEFEEKRKEKSNEIENISKLISSDKDKLKLLKNEVNKLQLLVDKIVIIEKEKQKTNNIITKCDENIAGYQKGISFLTDHDNCPTCKQVIQDSFKVEIETNLKKKISEEELTKLKLNENIEKFNLALTKLNIEKIKYDGYVSNVSELTNIIKLNESKLEIFQSELNKKSYDKQKLLDSLIVIDEKLNSLESSYKDLLKHKKILDNSSIILRDNGIKTAIIKNYIPKFNQLINKYLDEMNFYVSFELDENFNEKIRSRHRDDFTYDNFSAGERNRIDLAILFTWREIANSRNSLTTNLLIFDEILDGSLDNESTECLMKILNNLNNSIFVISHSSDMPEFFNKVLSVKKVDNFSEIEFIQ